MTEEQHDQYRSELNKPYTDEELELHLSDREAKSLLELTHAHNYFLINLTAKWIAYTTGKGKRPTRNLWKYLTPGMNNDNSECDRLNQLVEFYSGFAYGTAPILPVAFFCSRTTATLIARLEELYYTPHLDTIERAAKDFFTIITNEATHDFTPSELKATLKKSVDDFVSGCEANAKELHKFLLAFIKGQKPQKPATKEDVEKIVTEATEPIKTKQDVALVAITETNMTVKRFDNRAKREQRKKRHRYTEDQLNTIHTLWLKAQDDDNVKSGSSHKACYDAAVIYFKKEFNALHIYTGEDLRKALKAWSKRASRQAAK